MVFNVHINRTAYNTYSEIDPEMAATTFSDFLHERLRMAFTCTNLLR